jgi:isopropylmalate/homocitrate/citramalate synthase
MTDVKIDKRKISKSVVKRKMADGTIKEYPQYKLALTKEFVEEHGRNVILVADSVGLFLPNEEPEVLEKILDKFPEIRKLVIKSRKQRKKK